MALIGIVMAAMVVLVASYFVACGLTGENLVVTWWDQNRLRRMDLDELDAQNGANPVNSGLIVSLTTIPSRLPAIADTLRSLLRQTERAREIRLCLPSWSVRENAAYEVPAWLSRLKSVRIVASQDVGPATKFLGTLTAVPRDQAVLVLDDDRIYHPELLARMARLAEHHPDEIVAGSGWNLPDDLIDRPTTLKRRLAGAPYVPIKANRIPSPRSVVIVQGVNGYVVRPWFFDLAALGSIDRAPDAVRFVDDVWLSAHARVSRVIYPLPLPYISYLPWAHRRANARSSLGWKVNRDVRDEERGNSIALRYFKDRWNSRP